MASSDLGRVIGRQGRTAAALRTLLSSAAEDDDRRVSLDIRDQSGGAVERDSDRRRHDDDDWDDAILIGVVARTHGNRGEVIVNPETDFPEDRFHEGAQLMTRAQGRQPGDARGGDDADASGAAGDPVQGRSRR